MAVYSQHFQPWVEAIGKPEIPAGRFKVWLKRLSYTVVGIFAVIGLLFTGIFSAMQFGLLNVRGTSTERNQFFGAVPAVSHASATALAAKPVVNKCQADDPEYNAELCAWAQTKEWATVSGGLQKDESVIKDVSAKTGVPPRMLAAAVVPEQLRLFTSERESYKRYFEPLKVLGSMSKFSLGVAGIKQETANKIEQYANDPNSVYYPGEGYSTLLAYPTAGSHSSALYRRLTDSKNHYWAYMYAAVYLKEIQSQWAAAGYDISARPDVAVTLFNIGYSYSKPNANPQPGGTPITLGSKTYSFGELGALFYHSDELSGMFSAL